MAYSRFATFRGISRLLGRDFEIMDSQSVAGILGGVVAAIVLVVAFAYGPMGPMGKAKPVAAPVAQPATPAAPATPGQRGPVIREVPN